MIPSRSRGGVMSDVIEESLQLTGLIVAKAKPIPGSGSCWSDGHIQGSAPDLQKLRYPHVPKCWPVIVILLGIPATRVAPPLALL